VAERLKGTRGKTKIQGCGFNPQPCKQFLEKKPPIVWGNRKLPWPWTQLNGYVNTLINYFFDDRKNLIKVPGSLWVMLKQKSGGNSRSSRHTFSLRNRIYKISRKKKFKNCLNLWKDYLAQLLILKTSGSKEAESAPQ